MLSVHDRRNRPLEVIFTLYRYKTCKDPVAVQFGSAVDFTHFRIRLNSKTVKCWHNTSMDLRWLFLLASKADTKFERAGKGYVQILLRIYEVDSVQCEHGLNTVKPQLMWK